MEEIIATTFHLRKSHDSDYSIYSQELPIVKKENDYVFKYNNGDKFTLNKVNIFVSDDVLTADLVTIDPKIINNHKEYMISYIKKFFNHLIGD